MFKVPINYNNSSTPSFYLPYAGWAPVTDAYSFGFTVDKFGSILPMENNGDIAGYAIPFTTPARQDLSLSSMRMRVLFIEPVWVPPPNLFQIYGASGFGFAVTPHSVIDPLPPITGVCRPYPFVINGKVYVTLGGYHYDNYVNGIAVKVDPKIFKPSNYKELIAIGSNYLAYTNAGTYNVIEMSNGLTGRLYTSFGKKYLRIMGSLGPFGNGFPAVAVNIGYRSDMWNPPPLVGVQVPPGWNGPIPNSSYGYQYSSALISGYSKVFLFNVNQNPNTVYGPFSTGKIYIYHGVLDIQGITGYPLGGVLSDD